MRKSWNHLLDQREKVGIAVASLVDGVLNFLEDGRWHDFFEVAKIFSNFGLLESDVRNIIGFLTKFGFVDLDECQKRVKINTSFLSFLQAIKVLE